MHVQMIYFSFQFTNLLYKDFERILNFLNAKAVEYYLIMKYAWDEKAFDETC